MSNDYNIGAIRRLLEAAFEDGAALRRFCQDHSELKGVVTSFGPGMGLDDMVDKVIDFCRTRLAWDALLVAVQQEREEVYAQFASDLGGSPPVAPSSRHKPEPVILTPTTAPVKILFLAANPKNTEPLRLDEEVRAIDEVLLKARFRDRFDLIPHWAVRVSDLQELLLRHEPHVVHFSGHGSNASEIILENARGNAQAIPAAALTGLFAALKGNIRCVVLNACFSKRQAQAIAREIDCVVGMSREIGDTAAIDFAASFYRALGFGKDVKTAYTLGCLQIHMENLHEEDTPKLKTRRGIDAATIVLVRPA